MPANEIRKSALVVAGDEKLFRKEISSVLKKAGFDVLAAPNGPAALDFYGDEGRSIDLVVVDTATVKMQPAEIASRLEEISPRVLFLSDVETDDAPSQPPGHVFRVLSKPFRRARLLGQVLEIMDQPLAIGA